MSESDTENEGFDKEAEKRRLREKYEADRESREATSRMSDLLLQGATMTNKHCDTCGDPLFRYQGQEFCPSCQADGEAIAEAEEPTAESGPSSESADAAGDQPASTATGAESEPQSLPGQRDSTAGEPTHQASTSVEAAEASQRSATETARADLADTVSTLARRAAAADDPRQARELAEAAREAADGLAALR